MCLLQTSTSSKLRTVLLDTPGLIADIYKTNADGIGLMFADKGELVIRKALPKDAAEARQFIEAMPDDERQVALHWRWRTHGAINLEQCHPYSITQDVAMMHNGILHTGNAADVSKSDTWHFIEDYLKTLSADTLHDARLGALVGDYIEQNKFAIMSADGRLTVINKDQGVEYEGVWYSNTYAWSPELVVPGWLSKMKPRSSHKTVWDWEDDEEEAPLNHFGMDSGNERWGGIMSQGDQDEIDGAISDLNVDYLAEYLGAMPAETLNYLFDVYEFSVYPKALDKDLSVKVANIRRAIVAGNKGSLTDRIEDDDTGSEATVIAEVMQWYCNVAVRAPAASDMKSDTLAALLS